jgi:Zinc knuckle
VTLRCTAKIQDQQIKQRGVIRGIDTEISEQDLFDELTRDPHNQIQKVTRMMKNETDESGIVNKVPTTLVILEFTGNSLQRKVYLYKVARNVEVLVGKPTICFKCQKFGHMSKQCKSTSTYCGFCALSHNTRDCPKNRSSDTPSCINCDGAHAPSSLECPVMQHQFKLRMEAKLKETLFQPLPNVMSNTEFPPSLTASETAPTTDPPAVPEPQVLPPAVQRRRVKKFNEVLKAKHRTAEEQLEHRRLRYRIPTPPPDQTESDTRPRYEQTRPRQARPTTAVHNTQAPSAHSHVHTPPMEETTHTDILSIFHQMITNKQTLTMLITTLHIILSITHSTPENEAPNVDKIQNEILSFFSPLPSDNLSSNDPQSDLETFHEPSNMDLQNDE